MTARSSDPHQRAVRAIVGDERGAVLVLVALALIIVLLASAGLAIDLGRGYVTKARLSRAVDAAALAAARALRTGEDVARREALAVALANEVVVADGDIGFGTNDRGEDTVAVSALQRLPTIFMKVVGIDRMDVRASAEAAVPPLDIVLVVDISNSLCLADAWGSLESAATGFVDRFNDDIDQFGLVSFQIVAADLVELDQPFKNEVTGQLEALRTAGDTNIQEGLRLARLQITNPALTRPNAAKVVVFFTDGRATAMRGNFGGQEQILAARGTTLHRFEDPDVIPHDAVVYTGNAPSDVCPEGEGGENTIGNWPGGCGGSSCLGWTLSAARQEMGHRGLEAAEAIRQEDVLIYVIGLGNFDAPNVEPPDLDYLCQVANTDEIANPSENAEDCDATVNNSQPEGKVYFAPTSAELQQVFQDVARDLIVRLAS
ncbi:MAG: vWA domain-containing protein [Thermoanaerobaculia bacterium]